MTNTPTAATIQYQAIVTDPQGNVTGLYDVDDPRALADSLDQTMTRTGPRLWVDADGNRLVLGIKWPEVAA